MLIFFQTIKPLETIKTELAFEAAPYQSARQRVQRDVSSADWALHQGNLRVPAHNSSAVVRSNPLSGITGVHWLTAACIIATVGFVVAGLGNLLIF